ncbi:UNVERIFIED_CONTAM: hypothetical protein FKN15_020979 [Acipenser sinensis]
MDMSMESTSQKTSSRSAVSKDMELQVVMAAPLITGVLIRDKRFLRWVGETLEFRWLLNKDPEVSNLNI